MGQSKHRPKHHRHIMSGRDAQRGAVTTLGATHGRDVGCYHSLSAVPWDAPRALCEQLQVAAEARRLNLPRRLRSKEAVNARWPKPQL